MLSVEAVTPSSIPHSLIVKWPSKKVFKKGNMIGIILVKDFCPLKIKNTQFCNGFCFNQFPINVEQIINNYSSSPNGL